MATNENAGDVLLELLGKATKKWTKQKEREIKDRNETQWRRGNLRAVREYRMSVKEAAEVVMRAAYKKASNNGTLPAHARQIMYAARGNILKMTGKDRLDDAYFTQKLLPDYIAEHELEEEWDVIYDARGHIQEPHTEFCIPLGTMGVRDYIERSGESSSNAKVEIAIADADRFPTMGPTNRYSAILFVEKEGFLPLFQRVCLAERFDVAIMSTKGMSNIASRHLIDALELPVFVLHDFDVSGFSILNTLRDSTDRYYYGHKVQVVDLGLRLEDVEEYGLESEGVVHRREWSCRGITDNEREFLEDRRVELNAFTSKDLVSWIENKLTENGVRKMIPDEATLAAAWRRQIEVNLLDGLINDAREAVRKTASSAAVPKNLAALVARELAKRPELSWDDAIREATAELRHPPAKRGKV